MPDTDAGPAGAWAGALATAIGRRVRRYRRERGLTAAQVTAELAELGVTMNRTVLSNLENGYRGTIAVGELLALAVVLRVPPLLLLLPVGESAEVELPAGHTGDTWEAVQWLVGERPAPGQAADAQWRSVVDLLSLYREHAQLVDEWGRQTRLEGGGDHGAMFERAASARRLIEGHLRRVRRSLQDRGAPPPELPAGLVHIDDDEAAQA